MAHAIANALSNVMLLGACATAFAIIAPNLPKILDALIGE